MIETTGLYKRFRGSGKEITAVSNVSLRIREGEVFGLVGTNGAGKSTLLRILAGVLKQDEGTVSIDGDTVYDRPQTKEKLFFVPSESYFFANATPGDMADYYSFALEHFNTRRFHELLKDFGLDADRRISEFSKGMKRQVSLLMALCAETKYILLDETFDGLDPVMRQAFKSLFAREMADRGLTPVLSSHNLRELEDICDHVGLLHQGGVLLSEDISDMKVGIQKVQCVFRDPQDQAKTPEHLKVMISEERGRLHTYTVRGTREEIEEYFRSVDTVFFEMLPLTLEEIFISETEVAGYDIRKLILD